MLDYLTHSIFAIITLIGSIGVLFYLLVKFTGKGRAR
jgi:hypothetical protein